jgi:Beta-1,4-xylanase
MAGVHKLICMLRQHGVFIDGIGMQGHFVAENHPSAEELKETMRGYIKLVDEVAITELDVRIKLPIDEQKLQWQKEAYQKVVEACVKVRKCIGITLWDIYDPFSWVPHYFPGDREPLLWF